MTIMHDDNSSNTASEYTEFDDNASTEDDLITASTKDLSVRKEISSVGKKRKRRTYVRKGFPKKPLSSYNYFFKETRKKILIEHGQTNFQEMVRQIAALWKEISPEDKLRFVAIASGDLARYKEEVCEYERNKVEKSRKKLDTKEENIKQSIINATMYNSALDLTSVGIDEKFHHENDDDDDESRITFPVHNVRIPNVLHVDKTVGTGQGLPDNSDSDHTLSSNELQSAQRRLEEDLNAIDDLQSIRNREIETSRVIIEGGSISTPTLRANGMWLGRDLAENKLAHPEMQLYHRNLPSMGFVGKDHTVASGEVDIRDRIALDLYCLVGNSTTINNELERKKRIARANLSADIAIVSSDVELRNRFGLEGDILATSNEIERRKRLAGLSGNPAAVSYEFELREQFGRGADSMGAWNRARLKKQQINTGEDPMIALKEEEVRNLVRDVEMRFAVKMPHFVASNENEIRQRFGLGRDSTPAFDEVEIQKHLRLRNQIVKPNEAQILNRLILNEVNRDSKKSSSEAEIRKRLIAGGNPMATSTKAQIREVMSMDGIQNHFTAPNAELQKHLAMIHDRELIADQLGHSSRAMGMVNVYEENHLREKRIRQQERLMNQLSGRAQSFVQGGLSRAELSVLGDLRRTRSLPGALIASDSIASHSLDNADIRSALMQSQLSLLVMGRLSNP